MARLFDKFSELAKKVLVQAESLANDDHVSTDTDYLLLALTINKGELAYEILRQYQISVDQIKLAMSLDTAKSASGIKPDFKAAIKKAVKIAIDYHHLTVDCEHLLLAVLSEPTFKSYKIIENLGVDPKVVKAQLEKLFTELAYLDDIIVDASQESLELDKGKSTKPKKQRTPALDYFSKDVTKLAKQKKLDPVIGREMEINQVLQILLRRHKNNPILVGPPGVGKTAIAEGLANLIASGNVPNDLVGARMFMLDLPLIVAGTTYRGQFEERVKKIIEELESIPNSIVFIDELHTLVGTGAAEGSLDAANILKPVLTRQAFRLIGATTDDEYRKYIEKDAALERRFQKVNVKEPTLEQTMTILKGVKKHYESFHRLSVDDEVLKFIIDTTNRYLGQRNFPDKAIDVLDQASASVRMKLPKKTVNTNHDLESKLDKIQDLKTKAVAQDNYPKAGRLLAEEQKLRQTLEQTPEVTKEDKILGTVDIKSAAEVIAKWSGVPIEHILSQGEAKVAKIDKALKQHIVGQDEAIALIAQAIWRGRAGISSPDRPMGSFLFLGPTGVGKTELARNLAAQMYGSKDSIIKLDMSEFMERHTVSRLVGAPPGYVGYEDAGKLTEAVRANPYTIVLFDEVEKAHPEVFNILLQILEDGYLTDSKGLRVSFRNTIIILTSNLGMKELTRQASIGFGAHDSAEEIASDFRYQQIKEGVIKKVKDHFAPEFLNRLDHIIVFKPLGKQEIVSIVKLELDKLIERIGKRGLTIEVTEPAYELLAEKGFDPDLGARPIRRAIAEYLENPLASAVLSKKAQQHFRVLRKKDKLVLIK